MNVQLKETPFKISDRLSVSQNFLDGWTTSKAIDLWQLKAAGGRPCELHSFNLKRLTGKQGGQPREIKG